MAYAMQTKNETGIYLENFIRSARNLLGYDAKVCYLQSDNGTEFTGGYTSEFLKREGIEERTSPPDTPQHNGVAERFNLTLQNKIRSFMIDSGLPKNMWDLAMSAAVHVYNRTPHKSINYNVPIKQFAPHITKYLNE